MVNSIIAQFIELFINIDDFYPAFELEYIKKFLEDGTGKHIRKGRSLHLRVRFKIVKVEMI